MVWSSSWCIFHLFLLTEQTCMLSLPYHFFNIYMYISFCFLFIPFVHSDPFFFLLTFFSSFSLFSVIDFLFLLSSKLCIFFLSRSWLCFCQYVSAVIWFSWCVIYITFWATISYLISLVYLFFILLYNSIYFLTFFHFHLFLVLWLLLLSSLFDNWYMRVSV